MRTTVTLIQGSTAETTTMTTYTIGFTAKPARDFFSILDQAGVRRIVDVRLNNVGAYTAFTSPRDLPYFLHDLVNGCEYIHRPDLAPDKDLLSDWKDKQITWEEYQARFACLIVKRGSFNADDFRNGDCLLCSEPTPDHCHRGFIASLLPGDIVHL